MTGKPVARDKTLLFAGAVGASLSHEINNVLAVIVELNGLTQDLVAFRREGRSIDPDRVAGIAGRIASELERGKALVKQLNRFSHSVEAVGRSFDATEVLQTVVTLSARFARLGKIDLRTKAPADAPKIKGNLFDLQHLLFRGVELALRVSPPASTLDISLETWSDGVCFGFTNTGNAVVDDDSERLTADFQALSEWFGGRARTVIGCGAPVRIELTVPFELRGPERSP